MPRTSIMPLGNPSRNVTSDLTATKDRWDVEGKPTSLDPVNYARDHAVHMWVESSNKTDKAAEIARGMDGVERAAAEVHYKTCQKAEKGWFDQAMGLHGWDGRELAKSANEYKALATKNAPALASRNVAKLRSIGEFAAQNAKPVERTLAEPKKPKGKPKYV